MNRIKNFIKSELAALKGGVSLPEYITWWLVRLAMIGAIIYHSLKGEDGFVIVMMEMNLLATFSIPLAHLLFPRRLLLGSAPFRVQSCINIFVFAGSFLGHGLGFNWKVYNYDKILHVVSGFICVFIAALLIDAIRDGRSSGALFKTLASSGFSFLVMVAWEVFEFFSDYYIAGSNNQNYLWEPKSDMLFFKIFGVGVDNKAQYPVLDTNIDLLCAVIGCIAADIVLFILLYRRDRKSGVKSAERSRITVKEHFKAQLSALRAQIHPAEYVFWWLLRLFMVGGMIYLSVTKPGTYLIKLMFLNSLAMYAVPLLRFIDVKELLFAKVPYRVQSHVSVMVFFGSFLGHAMNLYLPYPNYDKFLHVVSGAVAVLVGMELARAFCKKPLSVQMNMFFAQGFSFSVMVLWELVEFFSDFYIPGSRNQSYDYVPRADFLFFKIFGTGKGDPLQYPVFDTNIDLLCAIVGSLLAGIAVFAAAEIIRRRKGSEKKAALAVS